MMTLNDLKFSERKFWEGFVTMSFPTALEEKTDMSLPEIIEETNAADAKWWDNFTKYYDGVLEETDGYIDDPKTFVYSISPDHILKIEFHPGDNVYYINDKKTANTGGDYNIQIFPFADLLEYAKTNDDERLFLLLLPLTVIDSQDTDNATEIISKALNNIFDKQLSNRIASSIVYGLTEE